jgi:hypothetical protein
MDRNLRQNAKWLTTEGSLILVTKWTPWPESASKLYRPSHRRLSAKLVPNFVDRGCQVVSMTDPYCRILGLWRHCLRFLHHLARLCLQTSLQYALSPCSQPTKPPDICNVTTSGFWRRRQSVLGSHFWGGYRSMYYVRDSQQCNRAVASHDPPF